MYIIGSQLVCYLPHYFTSSLSFATCDVHKRSTKKSVWSPMGSWRVWQYKTWSCIHKLLDCSLSFETYKRNFTTGNAGSYGLNKEEMTWLAWYVTLELNVYLILFMLGKSGEIRDSGWKLGPWETSCLVISGNEVEALKTISVVGISTSMPDPYFASVFIWHQFALCISNPKCKVPFLEEKQLPRENKEKFEDEKRKIPWMSQRIKTVTKESVTLQSEEIKLTSDFYYGIFTFINKLLITRLPRRISRINRNINVIQCNKIIFWHATTHFTSFLLL